MIATVLSAVGLDARTAGRRAVRRELAELELDIRKNNEIKSQLARLDQAKLRAADIHQATTSPAQSELATIDEQIAELLTDRLEVPPTLEERRRELLRSIADANEVLENAIAAADRQAVPLQRELNQRIIRMSTRDVIETKLAREPLANPELTAQHFVASRAREYASSRLQSAREKCQQYQSVVADGERFTTDANEEHALRLKHWKLELAAASEALAVADAAAAAIWKQIIDE